MTILVRIFLSLKPSQEFGIPIEEGTIRQIIVGQSTRSDVFRLLGPPHSMFRGEADMKESYSSVGLHGYFSCTLNRRLSSIDPGQYVLFYKSGRTNTKASEANYIAIKYLDSITKIRSDELLLLLNDKSNIVEDVAYRAETSKP